MFHLGQQVICIDPAGTNTLDLPELYEGEVYTVRWHGMASYEDEESQYCIRVEELLRGKDEFFADVHPDCPFRASRFRPLTRREAGQETSREMELF